MVVGGGHPHFNLFFRPYPKIPEEGVMVSFPEAQKRRPPANNSNLHSVRSHSCLLGNHLLGKCTELPTVGSTLDEWPSDY